MHYGDERIPSRVWDYICTEPNSGCWLWLGHVDRCGYSRLFIGEMRRVLPDAPADSPGHRKFFAIAHGRWPELTIDHKCNVRCCLNPDHLQEVSQSVNSKLAYDRRTARGVRHPRRGDGVDGSHTPLAQRDLPLPEGAFATFLLAVCAGSVFAREDRGALAPRVRSDAEVAAVAAVIAARRARHSVRHENIIAPAGKSVTAKQGVADSPAFALECV